VELKCFSTASHTKVYRYRAQAIHKKKLEQIARKPVNPERSGKGTFSVDDHERFFRNKQRISQYKESVRQRAIERDNQKLLKKLVEISSGRHVMPAVQSSLPKSHSVASLEFKAKSLHFNARKAELERIERENQKIAKKIFCL
jgi:hypothetical protein